MGIFIKAIMIVAVIIAALLFIRHGEKRWWRKFEHKPFNFPFRWHGKTLWYSRSFAMASFIFCKNKDNEWCVLANQRGKGAADFHHLWNCPCGYIDFGETAEEGAIRELQEETSIIVLRPENLELYKLISCPSQNHQNITARFFAKLEGVTTETEALIPKIEDNAGEKDEVEAVAWIPISEVNAYDWAFGHKEIIKEIYENKIAD